MPSINKKIKCTNCQCQIKCNLLTANISNNLRICTGITKIYTLCDNCIDINKFTVLNLDTDSQYLNSQCDVQIFMYDKQLFVDKINWKKHKKFISLKSQKDERIKLLTEKLKDIKMSYTKFKNNSVCKEYVNKGNPDLGTVIQSLFQKQNTENDRLCTLLEKLKDSNLEYDEKIPSYKIYITKGGNIDKTIETGELERDLILNTNYLALYDITDSDTAKEIVAGKIEKKSTLLEKYIIKKNTIKFD